MSFLSWFSVIAAGAALFSAAGCHRNTPNTAQQAQATALAAKAQSNLDQSDAKAADQVQSKTLHIVVTTNEASHVVQIASGADAPLPPDVLASWSAGVDRVRNSTASSAPSKNSNKPGSTLPAAR